eukprot:scaffold113042_cov68-Cyclotella_meneghiniana.AAC.2
MTWTKVQKQFEFATEHVFVARKFTRAEASQKITEVSCERFFGTSGYVSQPRRSRLGVCNYERISMSMLSNIVKNVYIDPESGVGSIWVLEKVQEGSMEERKHYGCIRVIAFLLRSNSILKHHMK